VLDGESAVPCNPQSATAGLNSHPRPRPVAWLQGPRGVEGQVPRDARLLNPVRTGR